MKKNLFNTVKLTRPKKSQFDLSHQYTTSMDAGYLTPCLQMECMPSDRFNIGGQVMVRMSPMLAPIMHQVDISVHYFFVPSRLLWPNFEKYITNTLVGGSLPAHPKFGFTAALYSTYKLLDYMGLNAPAALTSLDLSAFPLAAYQMIWNEYYRDQNLQTAVPYELVDGDNVANTELFELRKVNWEHDMYTASLPSAQKGSAVDVPIGGITYDPNGAGWLVKNQAGTLEGSIELASTPGGTLTDVATGAKAITLDPNGTLEVDAGTINDLRRAYRLQEWLERAMLGGSRYVENIMAFFGIKSQDARLQRPEYITGTRATIGISEVTSSAETATLPQGNMAGHGIGFDNGHAGNYFCHEHGWLMGLAFIRPKTAYMQGIDRMWRKVNDPFEYAWPQFANIGEQGVLKSEVYAASANPSDIFGYVPRYSEYKFMNNKITGDMKTSLDFWHWARKFTAEPSLNALFVNCQPDDRIFAVPGSGYDNFYLTAYHNIKATRPLPYFGTPTI